jgi:hypothetical protein
MSYKVLVVTEKSLTIGSSGDVGPSSVAVSVSSQVIEFDDRTEASVACEKIDESRVSRGGSFSATTISAIPLY